MAKETCLNHPSEPGVWQCNHCNKMFCEKCIRLSETGFGKISGLSTEKLKKAKDKNKELMCNSCYFETRTNYAKTLVGVLGALLAFEILAFIYSFLVDSEYRGEWTLSLFALTLIGIGGGLVYWWFLLQNKPTTTIEEN